MTDISALVATRVDADTELTDEAKLLVLAALESDEALADMAGFTRSAPSGEQHERTNPVGAFLRQIKVQGFRGIGPEVTLDLKPSPGLTVIAGRNGSGKSSFAEALEVALTGTTYRWRNKRSKQWQDAWRNLHLPGAPKIRVTLAEEAVGQTYVTVEWPPGAELEGMTPAVQRHGQKKQAGLESLGWSEALETFRPMLTYDELGALLSSEPSRLYDALSTVLGLEQLADAIKRLDQRCKDLAAPGKELSQAKKALLGDLVETDDKRATRAIALLRARTLDAPAIRALATGIGTGPDQVSARLREVLRLELPGSEPTRAAATRLRDAVQHLANTGDATTAALERRAAVLSFALISHQHDGDMTCPVCGQGRLDGGRAEELQREVSETEVLLASLRAARAEVAAAQRAARELATVVPSILASPLTDSLEPLRLRAATAWTSWADLPVDGLPLSDHLLAHHEGVAMALTELQRAAEPELSARDDAWARVATRLASYADEAESWEDGRRQAESAKKALDWLKSHDRTLKNDRLRPIRDQAIAIWTDLRQESNVEISDLTLEGANTRRHVEITSSVDGEDATGMTVLSQGELHALALALFLPRATVPESPFRFVVLDDPVQAMDPSKVDGLLTVLSAIAVDRQVVVFSHDDRLASAVRRGGVEATILEVARDEGSVVTVREALDPAHRYLQDARAMALDEQLPEDTKRRLLPGMLRMAVEARARDRHFTGTLSRGDSPGDVEAAWANAQRTGSRVALAVFGDASRDLGDWLSKKGYRRVALGICSSGFHDGLRGNGLDACRDVESLMGDIMAGTK